MSSTRKATIALIFNGVSVWFPGAVTFGLLGLLIPLWGEMFNVGRGPLGLVMTSLLFSVGVFMFIGGRWSDKYGARATVALGSVIAALSLYLFVYASSLPLLYVLAFSWGAGICLVYVSAISSAQRWLPRRRGLASGVVSMLFGASAAVMVPVFRCLLDTLGYVATLTLTATLTAVLGLASSPFIEFPEKLGYLSFQADPPPQPGPGGYSLSEALRTRAFWLTWVTWALCGGAGIGMVVFSTSISMELGLSSIAAAAGLAAFNVTNGLGRLVSGYLSDRFGRVAVMASTYLAGALGYAALPLAGGLYALTITCNLLAGLSFGTLFAVSAPFIMDCFGTKHYGAIFGFTFTAYGFIGSWLGPYVGGLLYDLTGSYTSTCMLFAVLCMSSALAIALAKPPRS
ncbi:MAG: MFS transporter [Thermoprotei archaeon]|nr:MAG: MFS transporter [Thermoprotei archaeon]